jgi:hypothetical protein
MLGWHAIIGLGEALITVAVVAYVDRVRPGLRLGGLGREQATARGGD